MSYKPVTGKRIRPHTTAFSPVALWQLNGTLVDTSGDGYDMGTGTGTPKYGDVGGGLLGLMGDAATGVKRTTVTSALNIVGDMTIEAIASLSAPVPVNAAYVLVNCSAVGETLNDNYLYSLSLNGVSTGTIATVCQVTSFWEFSTGSNVGVSTGVYLPTGQPFHIASVRSGTSPNISLATYVNGVLQNTTTGLTGPQIGGSPLQIVSLGYDSSANANFLNGGLASVKIMNTALTAAQIKSEYDYCFGI